MAMDVTGAASGGIQTGIAGAQPGAAPNAPDAEALARFENAMGGQPPPSDNPAMATQPLDHSARLDATPPVGAVEGPVSPGDAILRGLERMSQAHTDTMTNVQNQLAAVPSGEMMSASAMFEMQFAITQLTLQQDVVGKVAGKATQNLDSFLKNQ